MAVASDSISEQQVRQFRAQQRRLLRLMLAISRYHQKATGVGSLELHVIQTLWERDRAGGEHPIARDLAAEMKVDKAALSRAVAALVKKEWVETETVAEDGRRQHLKLTAKGLEMANEMDGSAQAGNRKLLELLPEGGRDNLESALDAYLDLIERLLEAEVKETLKKLESEA